MSNIEVVNNVNNYFFFNRYGARGPEEYKERLEDLCKYFQEKVDEHTQVIFMTTPPIKYSVSGMDLVNFVCLLRSG